MAAARCAGVSGPPFDTLKRGPRRAPPPTAPTPAPTRPQAVTPTHNRPLWRRRSGRRDRTLHGPSRWATTLPAGEIRNHSGGPARRSAARSAHRRRPPPARSPRTTHQGGARWTWHRRTPPDQSGVTGGAVLVGEGDERRFLLLAGRAPAGEEVHPHETAPVGGQIKPLPRHRRPRHGRGRLTEQWGVHLRGRRRRAGGEQDDEGGDHTSTRPAIHRAVCRPWRGPTAAPPTGPPTSPGAAHIRRRGVGGGVDGHGDPAGTRSSARPSSTSLAATFTGGTTGAATLSDHRHRSPSAAVRCRFRRPWPAPGPTPGRWVAGAGPARRPGVIRGPGAAAHHNHDTRGCTVTPRPTGPPTEAGRESTVR